jgi:hypothetical protein
MNASVAWYSGSFGSSSFGDGDSAFGAETHSGAGFVSAGTCSCAGFVGAAGESLFGAARASVGAAGESCLGAGTGTFFKAGGGSLLVGAGALLLVEAGGTGPESIGAAEERFVATVVFGTAASPDGGCSGSGSGIVRFRSVGAAASVRMCSEAAAAFARGRSSGGAALVRGAASARGAASVRGGAASVRGRLRGGSGATSARSACASAAVKGASVSDQTSPSRVFLGAHVSSACHLEAGTSRIERLGLSALCRARPRRPS